jgi:hypothetical protein
MNLILYSCMDTDPFLDSLCVLCTNVTQVDRENPRSLCIIYAHTQIYTYTSTYTHIFIYIYIYLFILTSGRYIAVLLHGNISFLFSLRYQLVCDEYYYIYIYMCVCLNMRCWYTAFLLQRSYSFLSFLLKAPTSL